MKNYILIGASIILILISIGVFIKKRITPVIQNNEFLEQQKEQAEYYNNAIIEQQDEQQKNIDELNDTTPVKIPLPKEDDERISLAVGSYFSFINNKQYDKAYSLLYDGFKQNTFPNYEEFEKYCTDTYSDYKVLKYVYYERNMDVLVAEVIVKSITGKSEEFTQVFSILEITDGIFRLSIGT